LSLGEDWQLVSRHSIANRAKAKKSRAAKVGVRGRHRVGQRHPEVSLWRPVGPGWRTPTRLIDN